VTFFNPQAQTLSLGGNGPHTSPYNRDWVVLTYDLWRITDPITQKAGVNHEAGPGNRCSGSDVYWLLTQRIVNPPTHSRSPRTQEKQTGGMDKKRSRKRVRTRIEQDTKLSVAPGGQVLVTGLVHPGMSPADICAGHALKSGFFFRAEDNVFRAPAHPKLKQWRPSYAPHCKGAIPRTLSFPLTFPLILPRVCQ